MCRKPTFSTQRANCHQLMLIDSSHHQPVMPGAARVEVFEQGLYSLSLHHLAQ
jgi:hypothetical protein